MRKLIALAVIALAVWGSSLVGRAESTTTDTYSAEELGQLVGPIALYPDQLVSTILAASTAPQELAAAQKLAAEGKKSSSAPGEWPEAVRALVDFPDVLNNMVSSTEWTAALGFAVANQMSDTMKAVQQYRAQAHQAGNLKSNDQQQVIQDGNVIVIQPKDPEVVYVPTYDYSAATTPYYDTGAAVAGGLLAFGTGVAISNAMWYNHCNWWGYGINHGYYHPAYNGAYWRPGVTPYTPYRPYGTGAYNRPAAGVPGYGHVTPYNYAGSAGYRNAANVNANVNRSTNINTVNRNTNINTGNINRAGYPGSAAAKPGAWGQPSAGQMPRIPTQTPNFNSGGYRGNEGAFRMDGGSATRAASQRGSQSWSGSNFSNSRGSYSSGNRGGYSGGFSGGRGGGGRRR